MTCCTQEPIFQTPQEFLDYEIDWSTRGLGTDTILTSVFATMSSDITVSDTSFMPTNTTFWLTGGIPGSTYAITNTITTVGGRTMQETVMYECISARIA